jgi:hypothetical protein
LVGKRKKMEIYFVECPRMGLDKVWIAECPRMGLDKVWIAEC